MSCSEIKKWRTWAEGPIQKVGFSFREGVTLFHDHLHFAKITISTYITGWPVWMCNFSYYREINIVYMFGFSILQIPAFLFLICEEWRLQFILLFNFRLNTSSVTCNRKFIISAFLLSKKRFQERALAYT